MLLNSSKFKLFEGRAPTAVKVTVTVASGEVGSNLTDFPLVIDLADMPSTFWDKVRADGGDIRAKTTGGAVVPFDVVFLDKLAERGTLVVQIATLASGSDNDIEIHYGDHSVTKLAVTDTNGRNAVWDNYELVTFFGESNEDRTGNHDYVVSTGNISNFRKASSTTAAGLSGFLQGFAWDDITDNIYGFAVNYITRYANLASLGTTSATNSNPVGSFTTSGIDTVVDGCVFGEYLYVVGNDIGTNNPATVSAIARFNKTTLAYVDEVDISANAPDAASVGFDPDRGLLIVAELNTTSFIRRFTPGGRTYVDSVTITGKTSTLRTQGIDYWQGAYWLGSDISGVRQLFRVDPDSGEIQEAGMIDGAFITGADLQGASNYKDGFIMGDNNTYELVLLQPDANESTTFFMAGGYSDYPGNAADYKELGGLASSTTFTMACTAIFDSLNTGELANYAMSYRDESDGATNDRASHGWQRDANTIFLFDETNGALLPSVDVVPSVGDRVRIVSVYNGTTDRKLYVDGVEEASESSITAKGSSLDMVTFGMDDGSRSLRLDGKIGYAYLRHSTLSADWITAEYDNLNDPSTFYSVSAETSA